jgi:hypothetical protein
MATVIVSMVALLVGLFVPKFIGLESIITMQLMFYSQLLIVEYEKWPLSFIQFSRFKGATGYNELLDLTEYAPLTNIAKKLQKLFIHKSFLENININFLVLGVFTIIFYVFSGVRSRK